MEINRVIIGRRIRLKREKLQLTRDDFSELIGISPQFLAEIEYGTKGMSTETLYKICEKVDITADYLLLGRQSAGGAKTPATEMLSSIPPQYLPAVEDILSEIMKLIEIAEEGRG